MLLVYDSPMWSKWVTMKDVKESRFLGRPLFATQIEILKLPVSLGCSKNLIPKFSNTLNTFWIIKQQFFWQKSNSEFAFLKFQALLLIQLSSYFKTRLSCMLRTRLWLQNVPLWRLSRNRDSLHRGYFAVQLTWDFNPSF